MAILCLLAPGVWAAEGAFVGAAVCAGCHPGQAGKQARSAHARSLHAAAAHPLAKRFADGKWIEREPDFRVRYLFQNGAVRAQGYDKANTIDIPVEWAFGAGEQAVTLVTRIDGDWHLEHHYSYYAAMGKMAPTAGQSVLRPKTLAEAMGLPYKTLDPAVGIMGCFECHSTGTVAVGEGNVLTPRETGVRCEACHGPGGAHVAAARTGDAKLAKAAIGNPKRSTGEEILVKCGACHRPPASGNTRIDWDYAWNVRHQPVYLAQSRCMTKSAGRMSCLTCHDPHSPMKETKAEQYSARCAGCHDGRTAARAPAKGGCEPKGNCAGCHMPGVTPQPGLRFTNHWIGVYAAGKALRPR